MSKRDMYWCILIVAPLDLEQANFAVLVVELPVPESSLGDAMCMARLSRFGRPLVKAVNLVTKLLRFALQPSDGEPVYFRGSSGFILRVGQTGQQAL